MLRQTLFAHYFGNSIAAAAFNAANRIPNFLQNLFGEGVLSASFIPVYARLLAKEEAEEADRVAGAVFALLALATSVMVGLGMLFTPELVEIIAGGFRPEARDLTIRLVRIVFPGTGMLVMSAWCLGILNSHRRFFLSYAAPVAWSAVQMVAMIAWGERGAAGLTAGGPLSPPDPLPRLAAVTAAAATLGAIAQFAVQLPTVLRVLGKFRPSAWPLRSPTREVLHGFGPVVVGRGVVQISAYVDTYYASLINELAFSALTYAQTLYLLPVSLFGMAVSAAELPEMSRAVGTEAEVHARLRARIDAALKRIAFFVVPSCAALLFLGDALAGAIFQSGRFHTGDTRLVWYLLAGSSVGLLAATSGRLYSSSFYALKDTRTPLYTATARVALTAVLAYWSAVKLPAQLGVPRELGGVGITATTGVAAWIEFLLLRHLLTRRIGPTGLPRRTLGIYWLSALLGAAAALGIKAALLHAWGPLSGGSGMWGGWLLPAPAIPIVSARLAPLAGALLMVTPFGLIYLALTYALGESELAGFIRRRLGR